MTPLLSMLSWAMLSGAMLLWSTSAFQLGPIENGISMRAAHFHIHNGFQFSDRAFVSRTLLAMTGDGETNDPDGYHHTLALLAMPETSADRIANEAILAVAVQHTKSKLSVVLQSKGDTPSLSSLRRYISEMYSALWDVAMSKGTIPDSGVLDVVVYPQNLPNTAPETWLHHVPDLDCLCSHDSICGWTSESALGRGKMFQHGEGTGGLDAHVRAINADRERRELRPIAALPVVPWPLGASPNARIKSNIVFLDDEAKPSKIGSEGETANGAVRETIPDDDECMPSFLGGAPVSEESLYQRVAVGGTFDGMHYGHRKLLTLAISSVHPTDGRLVIGVTVDDMLKHKNFAEQIPPLEERMDLAKEFVYRLAPGMKNRIKVVPISDPYGPPGSAADGASFDALVLSHETLENGCKLNQYREEVLGLEPLTLLCTRRTEPHSMSSTAMRRLRSGKPTTAST